MKKLLLLSMIITVLGCKGISTKVGGAYEIQEKSGRKKRIEFFVEIGPPNAKKKIKIQKCDIHKDCWIVGGKHVPTKKLPEEAKQLLAKMRKDKGQASRKPASIEGSAKGDKVSQPKDKPKSKSR